MSAGFVDMSAAHALPTLESLRGRLARAGSQPELFVELLMELNAMLSHGAVGPQNVALLLFGFYERLEQLTGIPSPMHIEELGRAGQGVN